MKKVYLDCGGNLGQGYELMKKDYNLDNFHVYMFEPLAECFHILRERYPNINLLNVAVWNKNTKKKLNIEYDPNNNGWVGGATNLLGRKYKKPDYIKNDYINTRYEEVECIKLSSFIENNFHRDDYIILKLDIEGAEFEVLNDLIKNNLLFWINEIKVEWHERLLKKSKIRKRLENSLIFRFDKNLNLSKLFKRRAYYINLFRKFDIDYEEWQ